MNPEWGQLALSMALVVALVQATVPLAGASLGRSDWMAWARPAALAQFVCVALAYAVLTAAFLSHDFSVLYVAENSNSELPLMYRVTAVWGGHEGSLLLWVLVLAGWTLAVAWRSRSLPEPLVARILGVMGWVSCGFLAFMLFTSNPLTRLLPAPEEGRDLNPLLQDPGMIFHPPLLYMGYVGFAVVFAFAVAALLAGRLDEAWARWARPWVMVAWAFLTLGVALGSWWAYYELGWGGWWFWDPVENASFVPWLAGTALMHSLIVTERRGSLRLWTALLALLVFSLSLLGAFLVRSGVLSSVHAFATDPSRGSFLLVFLVLVVGGSLSLFAWRAPVIRSGGAFEPVSRESMLLVGNVLLLVAAAAVLLGTLYPLAIDALGLGKLSVGAPYFEAVFVPLIAPALLLMALAPLAPWRHASLALLLRRARAAGLLALTVGGLAPLFWSAPYKPMVGFGLALAVWILALGLGGVWQRARGAGKPGAGRKGIVGRLGAQPGSWWGMQMAHAGVAVFVVGVTLVSGYETERDVRMVPGDGAELAGYRFVFDGVRDHAGPNYDAVIGRITVSREGRTVAVLEPEKRLYRERGMPMTEAAIDNRITSDLFVALGESLGGGAWSVRLYHKPFINWIWAGCALMALGGLVAALDSRYRRHRRRDSVESAATDAGGSALPGRSDLDPVASSKGLGL
ncbi:MAG: c-type cytochrome biogenesis protein CcmF [Comamonadaceae bacterium]|nr:c-type cytochrome biogenesis protein CcmF [Comamonadaceae bacterium]